MDLAFPHNHNTTVHWQPASDVTLPDAQLHHWLLDTGSLTERLQSCCERFSLTRLGQGNSPLYANEQRWLPPEAGNHWQVREVILHGDGQPWVFARSVLPQTLIDRELANLGGQPLGKRLFNDNRFIRSDFELCRVPASAFTFCDTPQPQWLWGRRSRFHLKDDYIIVAEIFLAGSPAYQPR